MHFINNLVLSPFLAEGCTSIFGRTNIYMINAEIGRNEISKTDMDQKQNPSLGAENTFIRILCWAIQNVFVIRLSSTFQDEFMQSAKVIANTR